MNSSWYLGVIGLVLLLTIGAQAQVEYGYSRTIRIYAPNFKPYDDVEGSPFVPGDSVQQGWMVYGTKRIPARLRYNAYSGQIEYVEAGKVLTPVNSVSEFTILSPDTLYFRKGFPAVGSWSPTDFYQLVYNGRKSKLLKRIVSVIKKNTETMANDFGKKGFQQHEEYYIWRSATQSPTDSYVEKLAEGDMVPVIQSKKSVVNAFPQHAERIEHYLADKKIKIKSWSELVSVLRYLDQ